MTLKEIIDIDPSFESKLFELGFDACYQKMNTLEDVARNLSLDPDKAVEALNLKINEAILDGKIFEEYDRRNLG